MLQRLPVADYLEKAAAAEPTPGGGSVAALAGALGAAMGSMVAGYTVDRPAYAAVDADMRQALAAFDDARQQLLAVVDEDAEAYAVIDRAYRLPKDTEARKTERSAAIRKATAEGANPPAKAFRAALLALRALPRVTEAGNKNLVSDAGVAASLLAAALRAAYANALVNAHALEDGEAFLAGMRDGLAEGERLRDACWATMERRLGFPH